MLKMFSYFVGLTQILMMVVLITFIPLMIVIRYFNARKLNMDLKTTLKVVLIPFSIGYYLIIAEEVRFKFYNKLMIVFTIMTLIGITFTLFKDIV